MYFYPTLKLLLGILSFLWARKAFSASYAEGLAKNGSVPKSAAVFGFFLAWVITSAVCIGLYYVVALVVGEL